MTTMRFRRILRLKTLSMATIPLMFCISARAVVYVDKDAPTGGDGSSWATAFTTIQEGIDAAYAAGGGEVWAAEGAYDEARTSVVHPSPYDTNTGSVVMRSGVDLYGGWHG